MSNYQGDVSTDRWVSVAQVRHFTIDTN